MSVDGLSEDTTSPRRNLDSNPWTSHPKVESLPLGFSAEHQVMDRLYQTQEKSIYILWSYADTLSHDNFSLSYIKSESTVS